MAVVDVTSIKKFYDGADIFITGGTGFLGRVLIEKLLRTCTGIKGIYVLIRVKSKDNPSKRLLELTNCRLFETLKSSQPEALSKLHAIEGDVKKLRLGLSDDDIETVKKCNVIFHCAASVRFDDPLSSAILMNTRGTLEMLKIAEEMKNLKSFVHVSTSYIKPKLFGSEEIFYPADVDWRKFIKYAETLDDDMMNALYKKLTKYAPNTYTFTKHLSEQICKFYKDTKNLPVVIYRPSIIAGSEVEPIPGWLDNLNGPFAYCFTALLGILHVSKVDENRKLDYIPVDICVKGMLIVAWKTWKENAETKMIPIYNSTSIKMPSFKSMHEQNLQIIYPSNSAIMDIYVNQTRCTFIFWVMKIFDQIIPALILDRLLVLRGKRPKLLKFQRIIMDSEKALLSFNSRDFKFINHKFLALNSEIPENERKDFFINEKNINETAIMTDVYLNFLENMLHEDITDFTKAKRRQLILNLIWKPYRFIVYSLITLMMWKLIGAMMAKIDLTSIFIED